MPASGGAALLPVLLLLRLGARSAAPEAADGRPDLEPGPRRRSQWDWRVDFSRPQYTPPEDAANYTTVVDPSVDWGTWEGWGVSLCWWAHVLGQSELLADLVFSRKVRTLNGQDMPGLGLNIARYNLGASAWRSVGGQSMQASPNIPPFKQMPGFWLDWLSDNASSASWDWHVDPNRSAMLSMAKERGVDHFELFSNSPMWWMLDNHNPSGSALGLTDNLQEWNVRNFTKYIATTADYFKRVRGIDFTSVEAFNEPSSPWWVALGTQEGCHFSRKLQAQVLEMLAEELAARGLAGIRVAASDENTYDLALGTWRSLPEAAKGVVRQLNTHGYQYASGQRGSLSQAAAGTALWNSEYGDPSPSGLEMATNLNLDLRQLHPVAWCYWQAVDEADGWGLFQSDLRSPSPRVDKVNVKYFVLAHYSRHIRPGMTIIDGGEANTVAAYDRAAQRLVLVTVNYGREQWVTYDLTKFARIRGPATRWTTNTDGGDTYAERGDLDVGSVVRAHMAANTVQTVEVDGVEVGETVVV